MSRKFLLIIEKEDDAAFSPRYQFNIASQAGNVDETWRKLFTRFVCVFLLLSACLTVNVSGVKAMEEAEMKLLVISNVQPSVWDKLAKKKIFFGHQSVGFNIMDGIKNIKGAFPLINLNIVELDQLDKISGPGFYHGRVGQNSDTFSKIDDFASQVDAGIGGTADIAFFKFCYVDIGYDTDIQKVFSHYKETMSRLRGKYPTTKFVHFTIPLGTTLTTWKTRLKTLMGKKDIWEYDANIRKNEFNDLLRECYAGKEPVFDIAYFESTYPDKKRSTFSKDSKLYFDLAPEYTYDDGHLNKMGQQWVAEQLLLFLSRIQ